MTQALNIDRANNTISGVTFTVPPRSTAKPLVTTPTLVSSIAFGQNATPNQMIASIDKATKRMAELLEQLHAQRRTIDKLQESNESLNSRTKIAEADAQQHQVRASEALLKVETLQAQQQLNTDEHDRLTASISTLLAMFGGETMLR